MANGNFFDKFSRKKPEQGKVNKPPYYPSAAKPAPSPLNDALKDFAAQPRSPKPSAPATPPPPSSPTMPSVYPVAHMKVALSYMDEVDARAEKPMTTSDAWELLDKLTTAAEHITKARAQDPSATITAYTKDKKPFQQTQDDISARLLYREGKLAVVAAKAWPGAGVVNEDAEGYKNLLRGKTALESATRYHPNDADYQYELAEVLKLMGEKEGAVAAAKRAIQLDSSHVNAIKFLDASGGEFVPLWKNAPTPKVPMKIPYKTICFGGGVLILFIGSQVGEHTNFRYTAVIPLVSFALFAAGYFRYRFERSVENSYRAYESARMDKDIADLRRDIHEDRYQQEKEDRNRR